MGVGVRKSFSNDMDHSDWGSWKVVRFNPSLTLKRKQVKQRKAASTGMAAKADLAKYLIKMDGKRDGRDQQAPHSWYILTLSRHCRLYKI